MSEQQLLKFIADEDKARLAPAAAKKTWWDVMTDEQKDKWLADFVNGGHVGEHFSQCHQPRNHGWQRCVCSCSAIRAETRSWFASYFTDALAAQRLFDSLCHAQHLNIRSQFDSFIRSPPTPESRSVLNTFLSTFCSESSGLKMDVRHC